DTGRLHKGPVVRAEGPGDDRLEDLRPDQVERAGDEEGAGERGGGQVEVAGHRCPSPGSVTGRWAARGVPRPDPLYAAAGGQDPVDTDAHHDRAPAGGLG